MGRVPCREFARAVDFVIPRRGRGHGQGRKTLENQGDKNRNSNGLHGLRNRDIDSIGQMFRGNQVKISGGTISSQNCEGVFCTIESFRKIQKKIEEFMAQLHGGKGSKGSKTGPHILKNGSQRFLNSRAFIALAFFFR